MNDLVCDFAKFQTDKFLIGCKAKEASGGSVEPFRWLVGENGAFEGIPIVNGKHLDTDWFQLGNSDPNNELVCYVDPLLGVSSAENGRVRKSFVQELPIFKPYQHFSEHVFDEKIGSGQFVCIPV